MLLLSFFTGNFPRNAALHRQWGSDLRVGNDLLPEPDDSFRAEGELLHGGAAAERGRRAHEVLRFTSVPSSLQRHELRNC